MLDDGTPTTRNCAVSGWVATIMGLCVGVLVQAQTNPVGCERRFSGPHVIISAALNAQSAFAADFDADGDTDVLSAFGRFPGTVAWFENTDGVGTFGPQQVITTAVSRPLSVFVADLDGDGDANILSASASDGKITWYENTDGLGTSGPQNVITADADGANRYGFLRRGADAKSLLDGALESGIGRVGGASGPRRRAHRYR